MKFPFMIGAVFMALILMSGPCRAQTFAENAYEKGIEYAIQGKFREAKEEFIKGLDFDPNDDYLKRCLTLAQDVIKNRLTAETAAHLFKSADFANKGRLDESIAEDKKAIGKTPNCSPAYSSLGASYIQKSQFGQAVFYLDKAIETDPLSCDAYVLRGLAFSRQKRYVESIRDYTKAIEIDPGDAGIYFNRALVYFFQGNFRKALMDANKARELGYPVPREFIDDVRRTARSGI